jgi:hypothetical protein
MAEKVYFTEFVNDLLWWDDKTKKWRPTAEHVDAAATNEKDYEWVWAWDGQLPKEHPDAAANNEQATKAIDEVEAAIIKAVEGRDG